MAKQLKVRSLMTTQDAGVRLFAFFLRADQIMQVADISRLARDSSGTVVGYQRYEATRHVTEIVDYLESGTVLFPNAIVMAMSSCAVFKKSRGPQVGERCTAGVLAIPIRPEGNRAAWIVDGQQRTLALNRCRRHDLLIPVTAFESDDFQVHRTQFLLVNKVQPLPNALINELLPEVNTALPPGLAKNKIPSALCNILNKDPESPFRGLIARQTTDRREDRTAVVTDTGLIQVIRESLNKPHGCLYQYRNVATGEVDVDMARRMLNMYWSEVRDAFPKAWGLPPDKSRLMGGVGIKAMGILMDRILGSVQPDESTVKSRVRDAMSRIKEHCAWTEGAWRRLNNMHWKQLQNTPSDVKQLANMLIRAYLGIHEA